MRLLVVSVVLCLFVSSLAYKNPNCNDKQVIVHLFEWKWDWIAEECETVLAPKGYCGVQVSPPQEHIQGDAWWTRYQVASYKLESRSGTRQQFINMVERCNAVGVNVIVDLVLNHMTGESGVGVAGSEMNGQYYPAVPYGPNDFNQPPCEVFDYQNPIEVRNCYLLGMNDLNQGSNYVREKIAEYVTDLTNIGVKGFRVDAAKHMWPGDLDFVQALWPDIDGDRPFVFQEVIDLGHEGIKMQEYVHLGKVTEFNSGAWISCLRKEGFGCLKNYGQGLLGGLDALTFVDNHDNQRTDPHIIVHTDDRNYKLAVGFLLAHEYGFKRVMSSFSFSHFDQGPPSIAPNPAGQHCGNGWVCEHRWSSIMNLVEFSNAMAGQPVENWQEFEGKTLGFSRGNKGFFAMGDLNNTEFYTGLPDGEYCDIVHDCAQKIQVSNGKARLSAYQANDPVVAFYVQ